MPHDLHRTVEDCDKQHHVVDKMHGRLWSAIKVISGATVAMMASLLVAVGVAWSASAATSAIERDVSAIEKSQQQDRTYLEKTLNQIQSDVREIRETQIRMLGKQREGTNPGISGQPN